MAVGSGSTGPPIIVRRRAAYLMTGPALAAHVITGTSGGARNARNPQDVQATGARVRFSF